MSTIRIERLPNGFYRRTDRRSGLTQLYNADGTKRSGQGGPQRIDVPQS